MKKISTYFLLFFLFSCASSREPLKREITYSSAWEDKGFSISLEKEHSVLDVCPFELTLRNKNSKSYSNVYLEFTAHAFASNRANDSSEVNIGIVNFLVNINANETLKRTGYINKSCYFINGMKLSKFTFR